MLPPRAEPPNPVTKLRERALLGETVTVKRRGQLFEARMTAVERGSESVTFLLLLKWRISIVQQPTGQTTFVRKTLGS